MPKSYERRMAARRATEAGKQIVAKKVSRSNFSDTVKDIKSNVEGRERGQAIASAAKSKAKPTKMTAAQRKEKVSKLIRDPKVRAGAKKLAARRKKG